MKLRSKLILAFLGLAILPLTGIVLFNYFSSVRSFHRLVEEESLRLASQIEDNVASARRDLKRDWEGLGAMTWSEMSEEQPAQTAGDWETVVQVAIRQAVASLGETGSWFRALELIPDPPVAGAAPPAPRARPRFVPPERRQTLIVVPDREAPRAPGARGAPSRSGRRGPRDRPAREQAAREQIALRKQVIDETLAELSVEHEKTQAEIAGQSAEPDGSPAGDRQQSMGGMAQTGGTPSAAKDAEKDLEKNMEHLALQSRRLKRVLGDDFASNISGLGWLHADIDLERFFREVLARSPRDNGEVPFAIAEDGAVFTVWPEDRASLDDLAGGAEDVGAVLSGKAELVERDGWVVATRPDAESGLTFGIARPIQASIAEMQRTSGRNLALGLGLVGLSLFGVLPISGRMSRRIRRLTAEADRLAAGDLTARVPVQGRDEIGQLGSAFNRMAGDLERHQVRLLEQEREGKEREVERRLLAAENARRGQELEDARQFQLSMLPKALPEFPGLEVEVLMRTATEVGGDYYDFSTHEDALTVAIGDATGHGARAGTMVTVIKTLFATKGAGGSLTEFLADATAGVRAMDLERMTMALALVRFTGDHLEVASAGMPPVLIFRAAAGRVEELDLEGLPLGALAGARYRSRETRLESGDCVLLMSDGFPEIRDEHGDTIGYPPVLRLFAEVGPLPIDQAIAKLESEVERRTRGLAPTDDVTFVLRRYRGPDAATPRT